MCHSRQLIRNPHDGRHYWVKCGQCDACLQERADAHRARIHRELLHSINGNEALGCFFVTLHYKNEELPFVKHDELKDFFSSAVIYSRCKNPTKMPFPLLYVYRNAFKPYSIDTFSMTDFQYLKRKETFDFSNYLNTLDYLPYARQKVNRTKTRYIPNTVAVLYQRDIQNFFKRLKINLFRSGYDSYFSYTYAGEYGEDHKRCHFHALIYFDKRFQSLIKHIIIKSWPYADLSRPFRDEKGRLRESVEVAKNPASYVSEYINLKSIVPLVLKDSKCFAPKVKFSQGFGLHFKYFTSDEIRKMFYKSDLRYPIEQIINGISSVNLVQVPKYVLSKYFPKPKGFKYLSSDEIFDLLRQPEKVCEEGYIDKMRLYPEDVSRIETFIRNKREEWCCLCKDDYPDVDSVVLRRALAISDFAWIGSRIWFLYASQCIKHSYDDVKTEQDLFEHFDNISDYFEGRCSNEILDRFFDPRKTYARDPNEFLRNLSDHVRLKDKFDRSIKKHRSHGMYENKVIYNYL